MTAGLRLSDVIVEAGSTRILDGVSLDLPGGRIIAIVGANGAGKTTLLDVICGAVRETSGIVDVAGHNGSSTGRRAGIGRVWQGSPLPQTLTVAEVASLVTNDKDETAAVLARFGLTPHATSFVAELSTGMRRILDLAIATVGEPGILLLDEPASGLAQSEIDHLAGVVRSWRDQTGASVIVVEHDASLVKALADEVIIMEAGKIVEMGALEEILIAPRGKAQRISRPHDEHFEQALKRVSAGATPRAALPKRTLSKWTVMRLGLREMSAGLSSVLILGVLSRVLHVERGISLGVVTAVLASYNLAAPFAVAIGHRSDSRRIFGRRRTPYIVAGAIITGLAVAAAPHVAGRLAHGITFGSIAFSVVLFVAMGIGMYGSGTVFFALLTDLSSPQERGHTASVVYLELMIGVLAGVALTGAVVNDKATNLGTLFAIAGAFVVVLSIIAVWGQEKNVQEQPAQAHATTVRLRDALREIAAMSQARIFFGFMVLSTLFLFLQQAVLTSFGGDVLHLSVRATSNFSAMMTVGTIAGMVIAGRPFAEQMGHKRIALFGLAGSVVAFMGLAAAASQEAAPPAWLSILFLGLSSGLFNVSSLALMMGMSDRRRTALFMGAWTLAHALADGAATAGGGGLYETFHHVFGSVPGGYAAVFALEAVGLAICLPLLRKVNVEGFASAMQAPVLAAAVGEVVELGVDEPAVEESIPTPAPVAKKPSTRPKAKTVKRAPAAKKSAKTIANGNKARKPPATRKKSPAR